MLAVLLATGCSGGSTGAAGTGGDFYVVNTDPRNNGTVFLNDPIRIDFSNPIDFTSADLNTVAFQVFNAAGDPIAEQVAGSFRLARAPGDAEVGRRLEFIPRFPTDDAFSNGGFRAGRGYLIQLVAGERRRGSALLSASGRTMSRPATFRIGTVNGSTPRELFRDTRAGGPRRTGFSVSGGESAAYLNKGGQAPVEVVLQFDQPLNPHSENVPIGVDLDPVTRDPKGRGRIFLQYDDPVLGPDQWIPARVVLAANELTGSEVRLFPVGLLPNQATIEVVVERTLEDMSGQSNGSDPAFDRVFATFTTRPALEPQFDAVVETFDTADRLDLEAPFLEPSAEVGKGFVRANFDFEGPSTVIDFEPTTSEVVLNTDFTQVVPKGGTPYHVVGGVFEFRNVHIPFGVTVRATGSNPMVWLVTGDFTVDGILDCSSGDGDPATNWRAASFPVPGGVGVAGGGNGGRGSPNAEGQSLAGEDGFGPERTRYGAGMGGQLSNKACGRGSGGGGGSFATEGDPQYKQKSPGGVGFVQQTGVGGYGCEGPSGNELERTLPGGRAGTVAFVDKHDDNDFWGTAIDVRRQTRVTGELAAPRGGSGGGGGGDHSKQLDPKNWLWNNTGGGGGAGGGALIVKCLGTISIGERGAILANGGNGGGGQLAGGNTLGAGGGGGSGGMVVLMAGKKIRIVTHGETYAVSPPEAGEEPVDGAYDFVISADGGVGVETGTWSDKYPPPVNAKKWDARPAGAFGGMGIVQLMTPPGDNLRDGTNTKLDDNIEVVQITQGVAAELTGAEKERFLAWRGFPDERGIWVDDAGAPTYYNDPTDPSLPSYPTWATAPWDPAIPDEYPGRDAEGDIRPAPILLPAPFGHKSRVRTRWIDLGPGAVRLPAAQFGAAGPRRIQENQATTPPMLRGPHFAFAGTQTDPQSGWIGYADYVRPPVGGIALAFPTIGPAHGIAAVASASFEGQPAHRVTLVGAPLGVIGNRYAHYQAQFISGHNALSSHRILSHDAQTLYLSAERGVPAALAGVQLQIVAQLFEVTTDGAPGLGPTYRNVAGELTPVANMRFGFAFHTDPADPDGQRFPAAPGTFLYDGDPSDPTNPLAPMDLGDAAVQELVRAGGFRFVRMDVQFNTRFSETEPNNTRGASPFSPAIPRPELRWLVLPYRY